MKPNAILIVVLTLILNACSPFTIVSSSGSQPTPEVEQATETPGYQPVVVDHVEVEIGAGSPLPVFVHVSGTLPDSCAQVEYSEQKQSGTKFIIKLAAIPSKAPECIQDTLPFTISIPLSVINLPTGSYTVEVNGTQTSFSLDTGSTDAALPAVDMPIVKNDIQVDDVSIEIGVGSPIPVHAIVSGNLPAACAQLGEIRLHRDGTTFYVQLLAYLPAQTDCIQDTIPFRAEIPLNIVNLPKGPYQVIVNGVTNSFDLYNVPASPIITLERTACFGTCPIYTLAIYADGKVEFDGRDFVNAKGVHTGSISPEQVQELVNTFQKIGFFDLPDEYTAPVTDLPSTITTFTFEGQTKTIRNYGGCMGETPLKAPQGLCDLEVSIDKVTNSSQWIGAR